MLSKALKRTMQAAKARGIVGQAGAASARSTAARAAMSTATEGTAMEGAGEMVFTEDRMKEHVSPATFDSFLAATESGASLSKEEANEIAGAIRDWAMSKGCVQ